MREKTQQKVRLKSFLVFYALVFFGGVNFAFSQMPPRPPAAPKTKSNGGIKIKNESGAPAEKSIAADAKVNVKLCVSEGRVKINGWERNEIRAFVNDGSEVGFRVLQKSKQNETPVWVEILGYDSVKNKEANPDECLSGDEIEIDAPRNAVVSITSRRSETIIDSVARVTVENVGGDILLSNIGQGIQAKTYEGDITVEKSSGAIMLVTTAGNIVVFDVSPSEIGDVFKAKTNSGAIILQHAEHRQIEANSNSGSIKFTGELLSGGQYNFTAFNGLISLLIPQNSSSKINASYGFGAFNSEIPLLNLVKSATSNAQNLSAQIGKGEANLNLSTYSGTIQIKKQ